MKCPKCGSRITMLITRHKDQEGKIITKADFAGIQYFWCPKCVKLIKFRAS